MAETRLWLEWLARFGYAARGAVTLVVGLLALLAAVSPGGDVTGSRGAIQTIFTQPFGVALIAIAAAGLFGFALWRLCQSVLDADGRGRDAKGLAVRLGQGVSAVTYLGLGIFAVGLVLGRGGGGADENESVRDWTAWLLTQPFGRWLVAAVGLAVIGAALGMAAQAWTARFREELSCDARAARWVVPLGRAGYAARSLVFLLIGGFLVLAAWQSDPSEARGLGGALLALQAQPYGRGLFGLVALGLAAFGAFEFAEARYRRIRPPRPEAAAAAVMRAARGG
ncbi:DUF1206 domain-containing protein [Falsiroseomonas tokyonensis]|uniref:DUF1206 domain-containing protein n=1 Tax=Falsiroseomonas tokyonensis TaxID=430521 RepID=A0ABV7BW31_9PROT|nr:DUF1206 domain-containing protein [Falsiroseomonas tokyonensis]MBU8538654.1 DUF1206 domain-containing protein [Falsiroseomonas tokyonensis]